MKLMAIINMKFDIIVELLIRCSVCQIMEKKMGLQWESISTRFEAFVAVKI
jgi:hypothetical protein